jgi:enterobactin synthetase component D
MSGSPHDPALPARIAAWVRAVAPACVAVAVDRVGPAAPFDAAEAAAVARAGALRRDSFATGRRLARAALAELGAMPASLPSDPDGVPRWPAGFTGSISHADGLCIALAGRADGPPGLGVDLERAARVVPGLARQICRADEAGRADVADLALWFAAKEAVFKACFPATRRLLGFHDVHVAIAPGRDRFVARLEAGARTTLGGSLARFGPHVVAAVWPAGPRLPRQILTVIPPSTTSTCPVQ